MGLQVRNTKNGQQAPADRQEQGLDLPPGPRRGWWLCKHIKTAGEFLILEVTELTVPSYSSWDVYDSECRCLICKVSEQNSKLNAGKFPWKASPASVGSYQCLSRAPSILIPWSKPCLLQTLRHSLSFFSVALIKHSVQKQLRGRNRLFQLTGYRK